MIGLVKGLATTVGTLFRKPVTIQYPEQRQSMLPRFRGAPGLLWDEELGQPKCTGCALCSRNCPVAAISVSAKDNPAFAEGKSKNRKTVDNYTLDQGLCIYCGICVEVCPFDANVMTKEYELAAYESPSMIKDLDALIALGRKEQSAAKPAAAGRPNGATAAPAAQQA